MCMNYLTRHEWQKILNKPNFQLFLLWTSEVYKPEENCRVTILDFVVVSTAHCGQICLSGVRFAFLMILSMFFALLQFLTFEDPKIHLKCINHDVALKYDLTHFNK